ncbi:hypothetical protein [Roseovarius sp. EL26]|uniref:hypothetical protein n=1 Tax=Roseovarius sp. EL26 TaxID=2126672 RepID=UPI000EA29E19|nr:hypothetical protein [Roseovarius sp. EL26]
MIEPEIIDMLGTLSNSTVARNSPENALDSDTAVVRKDAILNSIRNTVLPRRLEFMVANGTRLCLEVNSARVTEAVEAKGHDLPDFATDQREDITQRLAQMIVDFCAEPGPLELLSLHPDTSPDADDVGITYNELERACATLGLVEVAVEVIDASLDAPDEQAGAELDKPTSKGETEVKTSSVPSLSQMFFDGAAGFALGRLRVTAKDGAPLDSGEACVDGAAFSPDTEILNQFASDLSVWAEDCGSALQGPQMILMRSADKKAPSLAVVRGENATAIAVYEARKLGAAVGLWKAVNQEHKD